MFVERDRRQDLVVYLQMPWHDGDLRRWLMDHPEPPPQLRKKILVGLLTAVRRIQEFEKGLVHNDIKLANVLVSSDCVAILTDFEMCKDDAGNAAANSWSSVGGSMAYIPPECIRGKMDYNRPTWQRDMYAVRELFPCR